MRSRDLEDLIIWQVARELAADIYRGTSAGPLERDPQLRNELRAAARGVMANIAAGYAAENAATLARGFDRAAQATMNLASLLHLALDLDLLDDARGKAMLVRVAEVERLIRGWQRAIRAHRAACSLRTGRVN